MALPRGKCQVKSRWCNLGIYISSSSTIQLVVTFSSQTHRDTDTPPLYVYHHHLDQVYELCPCARRANHDPHHHHHHNRPHNRHHHHLEQVYELCPCARQAGHAVTGATGILLFFRSEEINQKLWTFIQINQKKWIRNCEFQWDLNHQPTAGQKDEISPRNWSELWDLSDQTHWRHSRRHHGRCKVRLFMGI